MRRRIVRVLVGSLAVAIAAAKPALAADLDSPIVSGLPWRSGMSCAGPEQEVWRGRKLDVTVIFIPSDSWDVMLKRPRTPYFKSKLSLAQQLVISMPMMPHTEFKRHAACAQGAFDGQYRQMGELLNANPVTARAVIRLGWEFNRGSQSHPWGIDTGDEIPDYVACFRREAAALKSAAPQLRIEWTLGRYTSAGMTSDIFTSYPGDDAVDVVGTHYYDNAEGPRQTTQAQFDRQAALPYAAGKLGGILTAFDFAAAHGKKLAVSEWAMWKTVTGAPPSDPKADDPVYVANMYDVFKTHAGQLAYENYYGCGDRHQTYPATLFPNGAATYRQLWRAGQ